MAHRFLPTSALALLCKHEDPSSNPRHPCKILGVAACTCNPNSVRCRYIAVIGACWPCLRVIRDSADHTCHGMCVTVYMGMHACRYLWDYNTFTTNLNSFLIDISEILGTLPWIKSIFWFDHAYFWFFPVCIFRLNTFRMHQVKFNILYSLLVWKIPHIFLKSLKIQHKNTSDSTSLF